MAKFTVCVPSGWLIKADPIFRIFSFVQSAVKHRVYFYMAVSNRVDLNRSICVKTALDRSENLIMIDSDVVPLQPFDEVAQILREDEKDADIVIGVIATRLGILARPFVKEGDRFYPEFASMGFVYMPLRTLKKLEIVDWYRIRPDAQFPMYFRYTSNMSEDGEFFERMRKKGMKVLADKRIKLVHVKDAGIMVSENGDIKLTL
ncbi:hypothetical protein SBFV2_gp21 [Sulfolobales Beppu filamentous virus 2]|uniref:Uncharacterized protein n=1 Tax=Sulfolobales Beppu filamentous virus 2 TaxID=2493123 RepID=A0A3Q8Q713_9VIRU|nr:hypothetical protein HOU84_gp21 [Sulfolobales Beppu filamentous virus 2]AZI75788.1 hypothetical protein SBFV2_gp21 [Sulfolobales Beppu filamentous virus 2]